MPRNGCGHQIRHQVQSHTNLGNYGWVHRLVWAHPPNVCTVAHWRRESPFSLSYLTISYWLSEVQPHDSASSEFGSASVYYCLSCFLHYCLATVLCGSSSYLYIEMTLNLSNIGHSIYNASSLSRIFHGSPQNRHHSCGGRVANDARLSGEAKL